MLFNRAIFLALTLAGNLAVAKALGASCEGAAARIDTTPVINGWGLNERNHRFVPERLAGITVDTVADLKLRWVFALPDTEAPRSQPLVTGDTVVIGDAPGMVYALDRSSGCEKWRYDAGSMVRTAFRHVQHRGEHLLYFGTLEADLVVLELVTGKQRLRIQIDNHPKAMLSGSAVEHGGVIYQPVSSWELFWAMNPFYACCTFRGSLVALDIDTWAPRWQAYTIATEPRVVESRWLLPDHLGPSGAPIWSQPTVDARRSRIYVGTGQNYSSPSTDSSDAILAFDMDSGALLWQQQFLEGDAWNIACVAPVHTNCPEENGLDLDFGAPPILVHIAGKDYLLAGQKSGRIFALDPDRDGTLLWQHTASGGGKAGGVHFGMAVDPVRGVLYVPISDRLVGMLGDSSTGVKAPSLQAIDIPTGELLWKTAAPGNCMDKPGAAGKPEPVPDCHPGFSAAVTATDKLVFAPTLDGYIRAFDARTGKQLWAFNSRGDYTAVNGIEARGGAIDLGGAYLDDGQLFVSSGYGQFGQIPGNAFMVFDIDPERARGMK